MATSYLPILSLIASDNKLYDYPVTIGDHEMNLRLDIINGNAWVLGDSFDECDDSNDSTTTTATTTSVHKLKRQETTATTQASDSTSTDSISEDTVCAANGIYYMDESETGYYWNLETGMETNDTDDATEYSQVFSNYIYVTGYWAKDRFLIDYTNSTKLSEDGTFTMNDTIFVVCNSTDVETGGLGMGLASVPTDGTAFLQNFVKNGIASANSYSLYLNPDNDTSPELMLGGFSTTKFTGDLCKFDFIPVYDESGLIVTTNGGLSNDFPVMPISAFGVTSNSTGKSVVFSTSYDDKMEAADYPKPAMLDSRSYYNYIPYSTLVEIAVELNAYYASALGGWIVNCDVGSSGALDVYLGNTSISIPFESLVFAANDANGTSQLKFTNGDDACFLGILPDYEVGYSLLGTPFLRHAYLAVDADGKQLAVGQAASGSAVGADTNETELYMITAGDIPLAVTNNVTAYEDLTLTMSTYLPYNYTKSITNGVIITDGQVRLSSATSSSSKSYRTASTKSASGYSETSSSNLANTSTTVGAIVLALLSFGAALL